MKKDTNGDVPHGFKRPTSSGQNQQVADWTSCNARLLQDVVANASVKGGAVRFGYTRDGGAYSIGVYLRDGYFTDYIRPSEDIDIYLQTLAESFNDWVPDENEPPAPAKNKK